MTVQLTDARRLSPEGQEDLRRRVVAAVEGGMTQLEAARVFGVSRRAVGVWIRAQRAYGPDALRAHRRGRPPGEQHALSRRAQAELLAEMIAGAPDHHGLAGALWSRRTVADLIHLHLGRRLSPTTVGHYLTRWNITEPSISGQHPATLVQHHAATWWLTWSRPVPKFLTSNLMPPPGAFAAGPPAGQVGPWPTHLEALLAQSARGDLLFLLSRTPWQLPDLVDAGARLARTVGHPVHGVVRRWPTEQGEVLRRWAEAPGSELRLTLA
ncbi:MAG TPA: helix-turn-helix domain-containing protein [Sporichthyaceae bacterium]